MSTHVSSKLMPGSPVVPLDPGLKNIQSTKPTHLPFLSPGFLLPPFVSSPAVLWAGVEMTYIKRKDEDFFFPLKKEKKAFLTFYLPSLTLYNPLRAFSSKSNLAHVTIHPYPRLLPHSSSPHFSLSPLPRFTSGCHLSLPFLAVSLGGDMKGYLCADSRGRRRAELINSLSGADC